MNQMHTFNACFASGPARAAPPHAPFQSDFYEDERQLIHRDGALDTSPARRSGDTARLLLPAPGLTVITLFADHNTDEIFELYTKTLGIRRIRITCFRDLAELRGHPLPRQRIFVHDGCTPPSLAGRLLQIRTHWHFRHELSAILGYRADIGCPPLDVSRQRRYELSHAGVDNLLQDANRAVATASSARRLPRVYVVNSTPFSLNLVRSRLRCAGRVLHNAGFDAS